MDTTKLLEYRTALIGMIPSDGSAIGNTSLCSRFLQRFTNDGISEDDYWEVRQSLLNEGLVERGRGRGGSVRLAILDARVQTDTNSVTVDQPTNRELELYEPFFESVGAFTKDEGLEDYVAQITALQGRRITGGKWTRPDIVIAAVRSFEFVPGKHLEVVSFEVKPSLSGAVEGVFEALAHSVFAHRSFLAVQIPSDSHIGPNQDLERASSECARHGVGLYTFTDAKDFGTFDPLQDAVRRSPDPNSVNNFIATQMNSDNKNLLRKWLR